MVTLTFSIGAQRLFDYKLVSDCVVLGRSDSCDIALPGEGLSRQHCQLEKRGPRWLLTDQSKHGTFVNGEKIQRRTLKNGETFTMGGYSVQLDSQKKAVAETVAVLSPKHHEFVVAYDKDLVVERAELSILNGTQQGKTFSIKQMETTVGSQGSQIVMSDESVVVEHCVITVTRGRPMVRPNRGPVYLDGHRLTGATPIYEGDQLTIGKTDFSIGVSSQTEPLPSSEGFGKMIGKSREMQRVFGRLKVFSCHDFPVMILGESGTGKELAARAIHQTSERSSGPFVAINCGAIPENLLESELFGYEKGAFSGAIRRKDGAFHQADNGILFLDELGELSLPAQVKLLRVLESGEVRRVGGYDVEFPNVRIVAATNRDLHQLVREGTFREDLLFRLQVLSVRLPPLRERMSDVKPLVLQICRTLDGNCIVQPGAMGKILGHDWPGNVRELRNVLSRAFVLSGGTIQSEHIEIFGTEINPLVPFEDEQSDYLEKIFHRCGGNRSKMARELGIPRTTLLYKLKKAGLID